MRLRTTLATLALLLAAAPAAAQAPDFAAEMERTRQRLAATVEFIGDTRVDESDVEDFIVGWPEFSELGGPEMLGLIEGDGAPDMEKVLAYEPYTTWAASHGHDPGPWLRKALRIQVLQLRESIPAQLEQAEAQMETQMQMMEAQADQMPPGQMEMVREQMGEARGQISEVIEIFETKVPAPTEAEAAALAEHAEALASLR